MSDSVGVLHASVSAFQFPAPARPADSRTPAERVADERRRTEARLGHLEIAAADRKANAQAGLVVDGDA